MKLQQVSKRYLHKTILEETQLELPTGKVIGIIGENGSGKSTLLKLMAGLIHPTHGKVLVDGEPANRRIAHKVAYLSELETYYTVYTVQEMIDFSASQFADFDREKAEEIRQFMQLDPKQKVKDLSIGNRGRLKIVLTLARKAPYILMDEPLSGLDPIVRESIVRGMNSFVDLEQQTVVIVSHELNELELLLDMVILVRGGKIIASCDTEEIRQQQECSITKWMEREYQRVSS